MRRVIAVLITIIICFVLQTTVFNSLPFVTVTPNLMVIITSSFGFMRGKKEGMYTGILCGLCLDLFYPTGFLCAYVLLFMFIGYFNGFMNKMFYPEDLKLPMVMVAASDLVYSFVIYLTGFLLRNRTHFLYYLKSKILPELFLTLLVTIVLYFILLKVNRRLERIEKQSEAKFV